MDIYVYMLTNYTELEAFLRNSNFTYDINVYMNTKYDFKYGSFRLLCNLAASNLNDFFINVFNNIDNSFGDKLIHELFLNSIEFGNFEIAKYLYNLYNFTSESIDNDINCTLLQATHVSDDTYLVILQWLDSLGVKPHFLNFFTLCYFNKLNSAKYVYNQLSTTDRKISDQKLVDLFLVCSLLTDSVDVINWLYSSVYITGDDLNDVVSIMTNFSFDSVYEYIKKRNIDYLPPTIYNKTTFDTNKVIDLLFSYM